MQKTLQPAGYAKKVAQIVRAMSPDMAREVLHYAEYLTAKRDADARWDVLLAATPDDALQRFVDDAMNGDETDIDDSGKVLKPVLTSSK